VTANRKSPNTLALHRQRGPLAADASAFVPYATGGLGGLTMFEKQPRREQSRHVSDRNVGASKWYAPNGFWGLPVITGSWRRGRRQRAEFFGQETRYGHPVYGAVIINAFGNGPHHKTKRSVREYSRKYCDSAAAWRRRFPIGTRRVPVHAGGVCRGTAASRSLVAPATEQRVTTSSE